MPRGTPFYTRAQLDALGTALVALCQTQALPREFDLGDVEAAGGPPRFAQGAIAHDPRGLETLQRRIRWTVGMFTSLRYRPREPRRGQTPAVAAAWRVGY